MKSLIFQTISRLVLYLLLVLSVFLLMKGHNAPGGGFIAGLLAASSLILQLLAFDLEYGKRILPINYINLVAVGLILAASVGIVPMVVGLPFLTSAFGTIELPLLGNMEWTSVFLFDLGVYFVVIGVLMTVVTQIAGDKLHPAHHDEARRAVKEDSELWKP